MRKETIDNPRYPHIVRITRILERDNAWLYDDEERTEKIVYQGRGRLSTNGSVQGQAVDLTTRTLSIPVNVNGWDELYPMSGDIVTVTMGNVTETMEVKDFEPDNNRSVVYCKRNGDLDL